MKPSIPHSSVLWTVAFALAFLFAVISASSAHPVAQGQLNVAVYEDRIEIAAHVSNEEILIASAYGSQPPVKDATASQTTHGLYILDHLFVEADGQRLKGEVTGFKAAPSLAPQVLATYQLRYALPSTGSTPKQLTLRQNILNEIMFAPGNPWEASFVTTVHRGEIALREGSLLTRNQAVEVTLETGAPDAAKGTRSSLLGEYFHHGFTHILEGWDHLLFVCALVLAVTRFSQLLAVVTVFTIAHTLTLVLSVMGWVRLPGTIVEPMIAGSIVFVAVQNAFWPDRSRGPLRLAVAFGFGLFHGLGFAGGLLEAMQGLGTYNVAIALIGFALGVEAGHQLVALPMFGIVRAVRGSDSTVQSVPQRQWVPLFLRTTSLIIAAAGCFYLVNSLRGA